MKSYNLLFYMYLVLIDDKIALLTIKMYTTCSCMIKSLSPHAKLAKDY